MDSSKFMSTLWLKIFIGIITSIGIIILGLWVYLVLYQFGFVDLSSIIKPQASQGQTRQDEKNNSKEVGVITDKVEEKIPEDTPTPTTPPQPEKQFDFNALETAIQQILGKDAKQYGVYISVPKLTYSYGHQEDTVFYPASVSKLPLALLIAKDIDSGKFTWNQRVAITSSVKTYSTDPLYSYEDGSKVTIKELVSFLLSQSDNTAMTALERLLGGYKVVNQRTKDELGINPLFRYPHQGTAKNAAKALELLYNATLLSTESNQYILDCLLNSAPWFNDRIPKGVPEGTKVAHKIGQIKTEKGMTYNDAGIVYGPTYDFILVVVNQDINAQVATKKIIDITAAIWSLLENPQVT